MSFYVKKFISQFLMPVPLVFELLLAGCLLVAFSRHKKVGRGLITAALGLFLAFGYGVGAHRYIFHLERRYQPLDSKASTCELLKGSAVVVLGQGLPTSSDLPLRHQLTASFLQRLHEGVHLYRLIPDSTMYVSLAGDSGVVHKNRILDEYARENMLTRSGIHLISAARDTADEARLAADMIRTNRIVIVTSAAHMPRAVKIFEKEFKRRGTTCALSGPTGEETAKVMLVPAPCDYIYTSEIDSWAKPKLWLLPLPSSDGFARTQHALYEGLGNLYETLTR